MATNNNHGPADAELAAHKATLQQLQIKVRGFVAGYATMQPKERARNLLEIQKAMDSISRFFDKLKTMNIQNTGTKFSAENLKQSFFSLKAQWRKFEMSLNTPQAS